MRKLIHLALISIFAVSLFTGCGAKAKPAEDTPVPPPVSKSADDKKAPAPGTSGLIQYDPDGLLKSFSDYIAAQDMSETDAVKSAVDIGKGNFMVMMNLSSALLDANHCVITPLYDDFMNTGKTLGGDPVRKQTRGDETTWDIESIAKADARPDIKKGDVSKVHISLNIKTNILMTEEVTIRGTGVINKKINKVAALPDGTVLSEYYAAGPSAKGDKTVSTASVFKYNRTAGELECISGSFKTLTLDFSPPSSLTAGDIDRNAYLAFADPVGTVKVSDGTGKVILP